MREPPDVTVHDPGRPAVPLDPRDAGRRADELTGDGRAWAGSRRAVAGALLLGCVAGVVAAHALEGPGGGTGPGASPPQLVVVTDRDAVVRPGEGGQPHSTVGVTLVNTGARELRVLGGAVRGSGLAWSAERPIEPGAQLTAVLADRSPCTGAAEGLTSPDAVLDVDVVDAGGRRRLALPLLPRFLRAYDADVRAGCGMPVVSDALSVVLSARPAGAGRDLAVPVLLLNRTVEPVLLLDVSSALGGTSAVLRTREGADVPVPLTLPGRSHAQLHQDAASAAPDESPHVLAVEVQRGACADLRARGGESVAVTLTHAYDDEPRDTADTVVALDLADLVDRACA